MVIKEMRMHMACPEACFQAGTAAECIDEIHRWMPSSSLFYDNLFCEAVEMICMASMDVDVCQNFAWLGPLNLFAIVSGKTTTTIFIFIRSIITHI